MICIFDRLNSLSVGQNQKWLPAHYANSNDPGGGKSFVVNALPVLASCHGSWWSFPTQVL
jgi:hypothetical protein